MGSYDVAQSRPLLENCLSILDCSKRIWGTQLISISKLQRIVNCLNCGQHFEYETHGVILVQEAGALNSTPTCSQSP